MDREIIFWSRKPQKVVTQHEPSATLYYLFFTLVLSSKTPPEHHVRTFRVPLEFSTPTPVSLARCRSVPCFLKSQIALIIF